MARIRTIKPDFWTDDRVGECSPSARLLFIATWNFADDEGGLDRSSKQLKAQAFPYDNVDCEPLVQELLDAGLLVEYEVDGKKYLHIKGFGVHQKIEKKARARFPIYKESGRTPRVVGEESGSSAVSSLGREGITKGMDLKTVTSAKAPTARVDPDWMLDFKLAYPERSGDPAWRSALKAANARMAEGHTPAEFIAGAKRYAAYCAAAGNTGTQYVKQASAFLGPGKPFLLSWDPPVSRGTKPEPVRVWEPPDDEVQCAQA